MLSMIVAVAQNDVIGGDNKLLWHISEDLKRFKEITMGKTLVMGRKTFESLPKILPGRTHVVITRDKNFKVDSDQVVVIHDINELVDKYTNTSEENFIIGGGEIYNLLLPKCQKLYLTKIKKDYVGDTSLVIDLSKWNEVYRSEEKIDEKSDVKFEFINYSIKG